nr:hypothetical protein [Deltaproteobacteria bacterium]
MIVLRLTVAVLSALILADCGGMHACTTDGVPCGEPSLRPVASSNSSGGARPTPPATLPSTTVAASSAPFVPPAAFAAPAPAPAAEPAPAAHTASVIETIVAAVEEDEGSGRHGRHRRHRGRHHRSGGSSGSHSRHHRRHR